MHMSKRKARRYFTAILLTIVIVMAVLGLNSRGLRADLGKFSLYWLLVGVLLLWVILLVLIDMLTIRQDFLASKRSIFHDTIGDPELLKKLRDARERTDTDGDEQDRPE
jgi:hypothetical protein